MQVVNKYLCSMYGFSAHSKTKGQLLRFVMLMPCFVLKFAGHIIHSGRKQPVFLLLKNIMKQQSRSAVKTVSPCKCNHSAPVN